MPGKILLAAKVCLVIVPRGTPGPRQRVRPELVVVGGGRRQRRERERGGEHPGEARACGMAADQTDAASWCQPRESATLAAVSDADREKWDARYRERGPESRAAVELPHVARRRSCPRRGRALDVAGGAGRHALWLAARGLDVTLVDISAAGLALARADARRAGRARSPPSPRDLEREPLPAGPFDLVLSCYYLRRELFAAFPALLAPGGLLVYVQPTRANLQRHAAPVGARSCWRTASCPASCRGSRSCATRRAGSPSPGGEPRHEARLVARTAGRTGAMLGCRRR